MTALPRVARTMMRAMISSSCIGNSVRFSPTWSLFSVSLLGLRQKGNVFVVSTNAGNDKQAAGSFSRD